jgi:hypothetical protein
MYSDPEMDSQAEGGVVIPFTGFSCYTVYEPRVSQSLVQSVEKTNYLCID